MILIASGRTIEKSNQMNRLNLDDFAKQIQDLHQRVAQLQQLTRESPTLRLGDSMNVTNATLSLTEPQQLETMATVFEQLSTALEELQVASEELYQQHQELFVTQQDLAAERQRYQELFEFAPDAYLVSDINGVIQEANMAAATLLNRSQQFLVGKPLACYVVEEERRAFRNQLNQLQQVEGVQEWEVRLRSLQQTPITAAVSVATIRNRDGHSVGLRWLVRDITERKRIELERRQANERLQLAATAIDGIIYDWDVENRTVERTQGLVAVLGYPPEAAEPTLDWWTQFIHPDDRQRVHQEVSNALANRSDFATEYRIRDKNHQYLDVWDRGLIIRNASGRAVRVVGSTLNISDRKRTEQALQRLNEELDNRVTERTSELEKLNEQLLGEISERFVVAAALYQREREFRALVEHAPDIIERFDRERRHLYVNSAIEQVTGKPASVFIGKTNQELGLSQTNLSLWGEALNRAFENGQEEQIEFSLVTPQGLKYYQTRLVPELEADGNPVSVLGISRDITDHKLALEALRESEERFRQLAENINEVFWMITPDSSKRLYVSPAYEEIWGRSCQSLYDQSNSWSDAIHPQDREFVMAKLEGQSRGESTDVEYRIVRPDGSMRWIRDRGFPVRDERGRVYRIAGIAEDITSRKQAELETYKALQRERELSTIKSSFVAMTSHEFRTPLTTIRSSADLLERYRSRLSQEKQLAHLQRIKSAVERMTQMLNDILLMSEAEAGKLQFNPEPLNLVQFCRFLVDDLQLGAKNQQVIHFTYRGDSTLAAQDTDETEREQLNALASLPSLDEKLLRHILSNLLSNALKYSPEGSTVQFDLTCLNNKAIFQIRDQGIGIPPADQTRLFESFHRANNVGTIQGTGLGLAIAKQCVDLHQGEITFTSEVGKGTTFTVTLPL
jgi:PAS domain S-box-containing protein